MTQLDRLLTFVFNHQVVIIEIIFALILGIVVVWLFSHLKSESVDGDHVHEKQIDDIQEALKRVLETTDLRMSTAAQAVSLIRDEDDLKELSKIPLPGKNGASGTAGGAAVGIGAVTAGPPGAMPGIDAGEVTKLRGEMELKAQKLSELEKSLAQAKDELQKAKASGTAPASGINIDELQQKIKSLESRLAEYEIIEDDIANLSLYKEENLKLKVELDKLKRGDTKPGANSSPSESAAAATLAAEAPAPPVISPPVSPLSAAEMAAETVVAGTDPKIESSPVDKDIDSDKLLKEFDALVTAEKKPEEPNPPQAQEKESSNKLIEEFEKFVKGGNG